MLRCASRVPRAVADARAGLGSQLQPNVILSGTKAKKHSRGGEAAYTQYVRHLEKTSPAVKAAQTAGTVENFAQGYQDYLQAPLQVRRVTCFAGVRMLKWAAG